MLLRSHDARGPVSSLVWLRASALLAAAALFAVAVALWPLGPAGGAPAPAVASPGAVADATPVPCGTLASSWGAATASDVRIQIVDVTVGLPVAGTPTPTPPASVTVVQVEISNMGLSAILIESESVSVLTCRGDKLHPLEDGDDEPLLGVFGPGESRTGRLMFLIPRDDQAARISFEIQEERRTGARVICDIVVALNNQPGGADVSVGCSARGGDGLPGASAPGTTATPPSAGD